MTWQKSWWHDLKNPDPKRRYAIHGPKGWRWVSEKAFWRDWNRDKETKPCNSKPMTT